MRLLSDVLIFGLSGKRQKLAKQPFIGGDNEDSTSSEVAIVCHQL
jgi:hypothetical protein